MKKFHDTFLDLGGKFQPQSMEWEKPAYRTNLNITYVLETLAVLQTLTLVSKGRVHLHDLAIGCDYCFFARENYYLEHHEPPLLSESIISRNI
jgi:hypothetical protein